MLDTNLKVQITQYFYLNAIQFNLTFIVIHSKQYFFIQQNTHIFFTKIIYIYVYVVENSHRIQYNIGFDNYVKISIEDQSKNSTALQTRYTKTRPTLHDQFNIHKSGIQESKVFLMFKLRKCMQTFNKIQYNTIMQLWLLQCNAKQNFLQYFAFKIVSI